MKLTIVLINAHFSTSAKFHKNIKIPQKKQILWLGSKFHGLWKTVGPSCNCTRRAILQLYKWASKAIHPARNIRLFQD